MVLVNLLGQTETIGELGRGRILIDATVRGDDRGQALHVDVAAPDHLAPLIVIIAQDENGVTVAYQKAPDAQQVAGLAVADQRHASLVV